MDCLFDLLSPNDNSGTRAASPFFPVDGTQSGRNSKLLGQVEHIAAMGRFDGLKFL